MSRSEPAAVLTADRPEPPFCAALSRRAQVPYVLLEVPSNMILERVDARRWLARIVTTWGAIATLMTFIHSFEALVVARLLLGVAEAGFFPGRSHGVMRCRERALHERPQHDRVQPSDVHLCL